MRILMISNHLGVQSGVQRYVQNLLLHLDTARYQIDLFVGQCPPDQASTAPALQARGVHIIAVPDHKKDRIRALWHHLRTHKDYDIIHYHTASKIGAPVCGMMRALCPKAKIIVHSHIVYPPLTLTWRAAHGVYQLFADYFLGCGVFTMFYGGPPMDGLCGGLCGVVIGLCLTLTVRLGANLFFRTTAGAAAGGLVAVALIALGLGHNQDLIIIGALMALVPGIAITNAMRDIMAGDMVAGISKGAEALLIGVAMALGTALALGLVRVFGGG